ncbi:MAG: hypothetical protein HYY18_04195 [Planctomycetes bacterium]|nr:hypothetical protein [Planctomycetota bacterium]
MLKVLRVALVALGMLSTMLLASPAFAGMVATPEPKAAPEELQTVQDGAILKDLAARAGLSGDAVEKVLSQIPAEQRGALAAHAVSMEHAGNLLGAVALVAGVIIVGVIVLSEMFWDDSNLTKYNP